LPFFPFFPFFPFLTSIRNQKYQKYQFSPYYAARKRVGTQTPNQTPITRLLFSAAAQTPICAFDTGMPLMRLPALKSL
jgi:hypothetical protein